MLEKFEVVDLYNTRSDSVVTIARETLKFNTATEDELARPSFVQIMLHDKKKQVAIRPCKESDIHATVFTRPSASRRYPITLDAPALGIMVFKIMGWTAEQKWSVPGVYLPSEGAIVYDLKMAQEVKRGNNGWAKRRANAAKAAEEAKNSEALENTESSEDEASETTTGANESTSAVNSYGAPGAASFSHESPAMNGNAANNGDNHPTGSQYPLTGQHAVESLTNPQGGDGQAASIHPVSQYNPGL